MACIYTLHSAEHTLNNALTSSARSNWVHCAEWFHVWSSKVKFRTSGRAFICAQCWSMLRSIFSVALDTKRLTAVTAVSRSSALLPADSSGCMM